MTKLLKWKSIGQVSVKFVDKMFPAGIVVAVVKPFAVFVSSQQFVLVVYGKNLQPDMQLVFLYRVCSNSRLLKPIDCEEHSNKTHDIINK